MLQAVENDALVSILTFTVVKISKSIIRNQDCWVASFHAEHLKYIKKNSIANLSTSANGYKLYFSLKIYYYNLSFI